MIMLEQLSSEVEQNKCGEFVFSPEPFCNHSKLLVMPEMKLEGSATSREVVQRVVGNQVVCSREPELDSEVDRLGRVVWLLGYRI